MRPTRDHSLPSTVANTTAHYHFPRSDAAIASPLQAPPHTQIDVVQAPAHHNPVQHPVVPVQVHAVRRFPSTTSSSAASISTASTASSTSTPSSFASFLRVNRRPSKSNANMPSRSRAAPTAVSPAEYAALPPSIQKKYFSPSERLDIAQQALAQNRQKQSPAASPRQSNDGFSSPACTPSSSVRVPRPLARPRAASVSSLEPMQDVISEDQALWFLTLPDKIRRQRFSKDELATLTTRCETVLHHASADSPVRIAYSRFCLFGQPTPATTSNHRKQFSFDCPKRSASDPALEPAQPVHQTSSNWDTKSAHMDMDSSSADMRTAKQLPSIPKVVRHQQSSPTVYASQPPYEPAAPQPLKAHYRPMRRKSLTPIALPPPTLSPAPPMPSSPRPPLQSWTSPESAELARPRTAPSMPELPTHPASPRKARNYQQEEARKQSRNRQASSDEKEMYVEAMNFGFPMPDLPRSAPFAANVIELPAEVPFELAGDLPVSSHPVHMLPPRRPSAFENSDTEDDTTSLSTRGPLTPSHAFEGSAFREFQKASIDSGVALPHPLAKMSTPALAEIPFTKIQPESVLRISRSRPELRELPGSQPVHYAEDPYRNAQTSHDPLKLESLQVIEGSGAFAVKSDDSSTIHSNKSGFLRFLKKF